MRIGNTSYIEALHHHPDEVGTILAKLRRGKSKERDRLPGELDWSYEGALSFSTSPIGQLLRKLHNPTPDPVLARDEFVSNYLSRLHCELVARKGRWHGRTPLMMRPPNIMEFVEKQWRRYEESRIP